MLPQLVVRFIQWCLRVENCYQDILFSRKVVGIKLLHDHFRMNLNEQAEPVLDQHFSFYACIDFDPALWALKTDLPYCQTTNFKRCLWLKESLTWSMQKKNH